MQKHFVPVNTADAVLSISNFNFTISFYTFMIYHRRDN